MEDDALREFIEKIMPHIEHLSDDEQEEFIYRAITEKDFLREFFQVEV